MTPQSIEVINPKGRRVFIDAETWRIDRENYIHRGFRDIKENKSETASADLDFKPQRLRIVIFTVFLQIGGAQKYAADLAKFLKRIGYDVLILTADDLAHNAWSLNSAGIQIIKIISEDHARKILNEFWPDIIIWNEFNWDMTRTWDASDPVKVFIYHTEGGPGKIAAGADLNIFVDWPENEERPSGANIYSPNGVDAEVFFPRKKRMKRPGEKIIVGYLGRIDRNKFPPSFVSAFVDFYDPDIDFHIYGFGLDGQGEEKIKAELEGYSNIRLFDSIPHSQVPDILRTFDIFLFPSIQEGCPFALLEAMSCGLAIAARDSTGVSHILPPGARGLKTDADLLAAIRRLKPEFERWILGDECRQHVSANFEQEKSFQSISERLIELIERRGASVMLPIYNPPIGLFQAVCENLKKQTFRRWTVRAYLDAPDDPAILAGFENAAKDDPRFQALESDEKRIGVAAARNKIWRNMASDLVILQDADDPSHPLRFEKVMDFFGANPDAPALSAQVRICDKSGEFGGAIYPHESAVTFEMLQKANSIPNPAAALRKSRVKELLGDGDLWESEFDGCEDYALWLRLARTGAVIPIMQEALVDKCNHPAGACAAAAKKDPMIAEKIKRKYGGKDEQNNSIWTLPEFVLNLYKNNLYADIVIIKAPSLEAAGMLVNEKIGLLFIDGDHIGDAPLEDYKAFRRNIIKGGYIIFHDAFNPEFSEHINKAIDFSLGDQIKYLERIGTMWIGERVNGE
jgi:glycosyltransferase involved in cell wall biosynthesis